VDIFLVIEDQVGS